LGVSSVNDIGISAISADGAALVGGRVIQTEPAVEAEPIYWSRETGFISFGPPMRRALAASADGRTITGDDGTTSYHAVLGGSHEPLPPGAYSRGLSADGLTVVGYQGGNLVTTPDSTPMRWTSAGGKELLGFLPGAELLPLARRFGEALAASADGSVVVGSSYGLYYDSGACVNSCNLRQAFRWTESGGMQSLGLGEARFISWNGDVVAGASGQLGPAFANRAFRWTPETGTMILDLPSGVSASVASVMNGNGSLILGSLDDGANQRAFIWDIDHGMRLWQEVLANEYGLADELAGWRITDALEMSADGNVILGYGQSPQGPYERFVVVLNPVPEPSALALAGLAAVGLAAVALRRRTRRGGA
jgi:uncharacterized membrane protein